MCLAGQTSRLVSEQGSLAIIGFGEHLFEGLVGDCDLTTVILVLGRTRQHLVQLLVRHRLVQLDCHRFQVVERYERVAVLVKEYKGLI
jgi:hypothetical protein|mmetsp:Transcript_28694/g.33719  ORF Transcript_28694/g.33719 Transcript_28694/m.33719 type:complete len:88 (+) Transcript_28694:153-416(+)